MTERPAAKMTDDELICEYAKAKNPLWQLHLEAEIERRQEQADEEHRAALEADE